MNHHRCIKIFIPKTNGTITADTFQWSQDNAFQLPTISNKEQLVAAAKNLGAAIKNGQRFNAPGTEHHAAIESLLKLFKEKAENICHQKLQPLGHEPIESLNVSCKDDMNSSSCPRVDKSAHSSTHPRVSTNINTTIADCSAPSEPSIINDHKKDCIADNAAPTDSSIAKDCLVSKPPRVIANHKYLTRLKVAKAANIIQMEQAQINNPQPVTHEFIPNIIEPPNQLRCEDLVRCSQKEVWERGMCNELGRLAQWHKDIVGRNTIFFTRKTQVPRNKQVTCGRIVCAMHPQKKEKHRVRLTIEGDLIKSTGVTSTPASSIKTIKCHKNSVLHNNSQYCNRY